MLYLPKNEEGQGLVEYALILGTRGDCGDCHFGHHGTPNWQHLQPDHQWPDRHLNRAIPLCLKQQRPTLNGGAFAFQ